MSARRRQTGRGLLLELALVVLLIAVMWWLVSSGIAAEIGRMIGQAMEDQMLRRSPTP